jgi:hypothetical protein
MEEVRENSRKDGQGANLGPGLSIDHLDAFHCLMFTFVFLVFIPQVTFATIDDREQYDQLVKPLLGQYVRLDVKPDGVTLVAASKEDRAAAAGQKAATAAAAAGAPASDAGWSGGGAPGDPASTHLAVFCSTHLISMLILLLRHILK